MMKTFQDMRKKVSGSSIEILNFNYARMVFEEDEVDKETTGGAKCVEKIVEEINSLKKEYKEEHDAEISASISGGGKVILISGVGKLYENFNDGFKHIVKMKEKYFGSESVDEEPLIQTASEVSTRESGSSSKKTKSKPLNKKVKEEKEEVEEKVEDIEEEKPESGDEDDEDSDDEDGASETETEEEAPKEIVKKVISKKVDSKPVGKKPEDHPEVKLTGADSEKVTGAVIKILKDNDNVVNLKDVVDGVSSSLKIPKEEAKKIVESLPKNNKKIEISDGLVWYCE